MKILEQNQRTPHQGVLLTIDEFNDLDSSKPSLNSEDMKELRTLRAFKEGFLEAFGIGPEYFEKTLRGEPDFIDVDYTKKENKKELVVAKEAV